MDGRVPGFEQLKAGMIEIVYKIKVEAKYGGALSGELPAFKIRQTSTSSNSSTKTRTEIKKAYP